MPFNPENSKAEPAPSSDPELNEMLEKLGKIIEENPRKEVPRTGNHSTQKIHEDAEYGEARKKYERQQEIKRIREEKEKARKTRNLVTDATRRQLNEKLPESELLV